MVTHSVELVTVKQPAEILRQPSSWFDVTFGNCRADDDIDTGDSNDDPDNNLDADNGSTRNPSGDSAIITDSYHNNVANNDDSNSRHVYCVTQQTCLLCVTADMSAE